jgi:hypothetical protein
MPCRTFCRAFFVKSIPKNIPKTQKWPNKKLLAGQHLSAQDGVIGVIGISPLSRELVLFLSRPSSLTGTLSELSFLLVRFDRLLRSEQSHWNPAIVLFKYYLYGLLLCIQKQLIIRTNR